MKKGILVICLMVLIASTAVVMAMRGDSTRVWIEENKAMILHYPSDYSYKINLTGPTFIEDEPVEEIYQSSTEYENNIIRDSENGQAKLFTVSFTYKDLDPDGVPDFPVNDSTGHLYNMYINSTGATVLFPVNSTFRAEVYIYNATDDEVYYYQDDAFPIKVYS